jgi:F0F1-type ATP synthase assembly protein I
MEPGWLSAFRFLGLGWIVVLSILIGLLGGLWLDRRVDTTPLFMILGLALGIAAAAIRVWMIKGIRPVPGLRLSGRRQGRR